MAIVFILIAVALWGCGGTQRDRVTVVIDGAELEAVRLETIDGRYGWFLDGSGRPVTPEILRAIERAVRS